jgi:hypothetical protein
VRKNFAAWNIFHHHIQVVLILEGPVEANDVRVLGKFDDLALVADMVTLNKVNEFLFAHHFQNTIIVGGDVITEIDVGKGANPNRVDHLELAAVEREKLRHPVGGCQGGLRGESLNFLKAMRHASQMRNEEFILERSNVKCRKMPDCERELRIQRTMSNNHWLAVRWFGFS